MLFVNVRVYKNDELIVEDKNTVHDNLKAYFRDLMDSAADKAINDLFTDDEVAFGGLQDNKDGIIANINGTYKSMDMSVLSASNTWGKKWRGSLTNTSGGQQSASDFRIGFNWNSTTDFETRYATFNPANITLEDQDVIVVEWEVSIA